MDNPLKATFRMSADELLKASKLSLRHSPMGRKFRITVFVIGPLAVVAGVTILLTSDTRAMVFGIFFLAIGLGACLSPLAIRKELRKHYAKRPDRDMMVTWEFYPDRAVTVTDGASSQLQWRMFSRAVETKAGFLLYMNDRMFHWLPSHAFSNPEDIEKLSQLLQSSVPDFKSDR